jgi:hypothetical protein
MAGSGVATPAAQPAGTAWREPRTARTRSGASLRSHSPWPAFWRSRLRGTPAKLRLLLVATVLGCLAWGAFAALTVSLHTNAASDVVTSSEPLSLDAQQRYASDIATATARLAEYHQ